MEHNNQTDKIELLHAVSLLRFVSPTLVIGGKEHLHIEPLEKCFKTPPTPNSSLHLCLQVALLCN